MNRFFTHPINRILGNAVWATEVLAWDDNVRCIKDIE